MSANLSFLQKHHLVHNISTVANEAQALVNVLQKIVQNAGALLEVRSCSIALVDATGTGLVTIAALQRAGRTLRQTRFRLNEGVAGWVAQHRQALVINNVELDARFKHLGRMPVASIMCVPLLSNNDFIGTLTVSSAALDAFDEKKLTLLTIFAEQAVLSIVNARHAKLAQRQANQLETLLRISRGIATSREPEALYCAILAHIRRLVPCEQAIIYLYQDGTQELYAVAEWREDAWQLPGFDEGENADTQSERARRERISLYDTNALPAWAALHRHPILRAPMQSPQREGGADVASFHLAELAAPFIAKSTVHGVLCLTRKKKFNSDELRLVRNLCNMTSVTLENVELLHKIRSDREELRAVLAASSDGIALLRGDGCFVEANAAFGQIFGIEPEQIIGMECIELLGAYEGDTHSARDTMCMVERALQEGEPPPYVELDLNIKGVSRAIGLSFTAINTVHKVLCLLVARDVTTIRDATRMKANFLSMITHELRSPINAINGYLDLTLEGIAGELNEQQREFLQRARAGSEHMYALLEDLLLISRADAGQLRLSREIIRLQTVIVNAVEEMELTAKDLDIALTINIASDFPSLYADAVRLQQVLRNLLSNAIRFTGAGGLVTVTAHIEYEATYGVTEAEEVIPVVKLCVSDNGSGIAPEFQHRIFERFFQVPNSTSGRCGGQGLGLAIIKMIVELHGGYVTVESTLGTGSTFSCTLPCLLS